MSHHFSGPDFSCPLGDPRLDLCDLYAFPRPGDASKSIFVMNAHPSFTVNPPGPTTSAPFATEAIYELKIDTNGDSVADIAYRVRFSDAAGGGRTATVRRVTGADAAGIGDAGEILFKDVPVSIGPEAKVSESGGYRFFAGWRSDPFFIDAEGILNGFQFTGKDLMIDKNVCGIVLEVPNQALGSAGAIGIWMRALLQDANAKAGWTQIDRGARPEVSNFLCPNEEKNHYLAGEPVNDARWVDTFAHSLEHSGGYAPEEAKRVARSLLPDIMPYDARRPAAYPANGRALTEDAIDHFLSLFTNGKVTSDGVGPHTDLLAEFPYLGPPHKI
ncbi:MAG: DUF4331 family protein [bacterium]